MGPLLGLGPEGSLALIAALGYSAVLHAHHAGRVASCGLAVLATLSFSLVVMAWYGVNYVLATGLHSYGFGTGGAAYVLTATALQGAYIVAASTRHLLAQMRTAHTRTLVKRISRRGLIHIRQSQPRQFGVHF